MPVIWILRPGMAKKENTRSGYMMHVEPITQNHKVYIDLFCSAFAHHCVKHASREPSCFTSVHAGALKLVIVP